MELAEGIRKIGFHRWYERQLTESHVYLVTSFLCLILVLACLEGFSFRTSGLEPLLRLGAMFAGGVVGIASLTRYTRMLGVAWRAAEHSICRKCSAYGALEVTSLRTGVSDPGSRPASPPVGVRCRKCGHEWTIE
ncbi:MAG: hypothetical protein HYY78_06005 [Betaproteobacteria bacterium]|nr:hypothetical protein [Betaproteobacteria bacterium]